MDEGLANRLTLPAAPASLFGPLPKPVGERHGAWDLPDRTRRIINQVLAQIRD